MSLDSRLLLYALLGVALMAAVGLERWLKHTPIPFALVYVAAGFALFSVPVVGLPTLNPLADSADMALIELLAEFVVIASLLAAGLSIDRPFSLRNWSQIWPLLLVAMPLTILAIGLWGWGIMGLAPASAILLGAVLAPTDPVLARSVQVGPPGDGERDDIRFGLTVEAGANDGLAFPFVHLAIAAIGVTALGEWTWSWALEDVLWRITAGVAVGIAVGRIAAWYVFDKLGAEDVHEEKPVIQGTNEGAIIIGSLLCAYGFAELVHGYGFLAVFAGAIAARRYEAHHQYHAMTHHFIDQVEHIVLVIMLLGIGGLVASGMLGGLTWTGAALGLLLVFVFRPVAGLIAQWRSALPFQGRLLVAFLGIRGLGSIYYLAYGSNHGRFSGLDEVWATALFTILVSIAVHGGAARPLLERAERRGDHVLPHSDPDENFAKPARES